VGVEVERERQESKRRNRNIIKYNDFVKIGRLK